MGIHLAKTEATSAPLSLQIILTRIGYKTGHLLATRKTGHMRQCDYVTAVSGSAYQSSGTSLWLIHKRIRGHNFKKKKKKTDLKMKAWSSVLSDTNRRTCKLRFNQLTTADVTMASVNLNSFSHTELKKTDCSSLTLKCTFFLVSTLNFRNSVVELLLLTCLDLHWNFKHRLTLFEDHLHTHVLGLRNT